MSNLVKNILFFNGPQKEIDLLLKTVKADAPADPDPYSYYGEGTIDFDKIIPTPECIFQGPLGDEEEKETGNRNWWNWRLKYWGVKRNAYNGIAPGNDKTIQFFTDYNPTFNVVAALSWLFRNVHIIYVWADETCEYGGAAVFKAGNRIDALEIEDIGESVWEAQSQEERKCILEEVSSLLEMEVT